MGAAGDAYMPAMLGSGNGSGAWMGGLPGVGPDVSGAYMGPPSSAMGSPQTSQSAPAAGGGLKETINGVMNNPYVKGAQALNTVASPFMKNSGLTGQNLADIIAGTMDYRNQNKSSDQMLDYMRTQQGKIDSLYQPGSPEWQSLWEAMSRKDAAAGRNSQYGPRTVDFMGKVADTKAKYTAELTKGLAGNYQQAFNQQAASPAGVRAAMSKLLANPQNLSSVLNAITSGNTSGLSGVPEWDEAWKQMGGNDDFIDYGEFI
jgi:hypothetical protein